MIHRGQILLFSALAEVLGHRTSHGVGDIGCCRDDWATPFEEIVLRDLLDAYTKRRWHWGRVMCPIVPARALYAKTMKNQALCRRHFGAVPQRPPD